MNFLEIKDSKQENFTALINLDRISSIDMQETAYSGAQIAIEIAGRSTSYTKAYDTVQDAQNVFGELKDVLINGGGTVTL